MATDDVVLNQATVGVGDKVRAVLRATGTKTQVLGIDVGGETGPEQLVTPQFPLPVGDPYTQLTALLQAETLVSQAALAVGGFYPLEVPGFLVGMPG